MPKLQEISIESKSLQENSSLEGNQTTALKAKDCPRWDSCSANICPLDLIDNAAWFPDEEICAVRNFSTLPWVKRQRKIARKVRNKDYFFTMDMLNQDCIITAATEGLDPDADFANTETLIKRWLEKHPEKKAKTKDQLDLLRIQLSGFRKGLTTEKNDQSAEESRIKDANPLRVLEPILPQQYESVTKEVNAIITREIN
jgi:hypothetical protein